MLSEAEGDIHRSDVFSFHKVQCVPSRYTAALLPRISAPWTASSPDSSTTDSARSLRTDWRVGCAELLLPPPHHQHKTTFSSPVKTPPTPRCLRLEKYCSDFCDGRKDGRTRGRLDAVAGSGDVMVGLPLGVLRLRSF